MSKELVRLLREIEEMSGKLYSNTSQDKDLRVCKGAKRLAELVEEGISAEEAEEVLRGEGLIIDSEEKRIKVRSKNCGEKSMSIRCG